MEEERKIINWEHDIYTPPNNISSSKNGLYW